MCCNAKLKLFSLILIIFLLSAPLSADIYYWTDKNGIKHFSNISNLPDTESDIKIIKEKRDIASFLPQDPENRAVFEVLKVYDGDSIKVKGYNLIFVVRLVGIDAPETGGSSYRGQPFSRKAKTFLEKSVNGRKVVLKTYGMGGYNRQLAEIFVDRKNINLEILKRGLAEVYQGRIAKGVNTRFYRETERLAKKERKGIWSLKKSEYKSPKQWRKDHPRK